MKYVYHYNFVAGNGLDFNGVIGIDVKVVDEFTYGMLIDAISSAQKMGVIRVVSLSLIHSETL